MIAITLLIVLAARSRNKATRGKITFRQVLIKQFQTQNLLLITYFLSYAPQILGFILYVLPSTTNYFKEEIMDIGDDKLNELDLLLLLSVLMLSFA
jgi:hypothetical protein